MRTGYRFGGPVARALFIQFPQPTELWPINSPGPVNDNAFVPSYTAVYLGLGYLPTTVLGLYKHVYYSLFSFLCNCFTHVIYEKPQVVLWNLLLAREVGWKCFEAIIYLYLTHNKNIA